jgi:hypothetical protein
MVTDFEMKYIVLVGILTLIACNSSVRKENRQEYEEVEKIDTNYLDTDSLMSEKFDIDEYKQKADSLISKIIGGDVKTKMTVDTLKKGEVIFVELKTTTLSNLVNKSEIVKYTFSLVGNHSRLKHHLTRIFCKDEIAADSIFSAFEKIALEKSGVPGLTYTSDYLVKIFNEIYWLNSNCSYSYHNHLKFVEIFKKMKQISDTKAIECECGKITCITSGE